MVMMVHNVLLYSVCHETPDTVVKACPASLWTSLTSHGESLPTCLPPCYLNNRAQNSHQPTRQQERCMPRLQSPGHARRFLAAYGLAELQEVPRTGRPWHFAPAARGAVTSSATGTPVDAPCTAMRWSSDAIATTLSPQTASPILCPSTLWRMLDIATLKPHRPV